MANDVKVTFCERVSGQARCSYTGQYLFFLFAKLKINSNTIMMALKISSRITVVDLVMGIG